MEGEEIPEDARMWAAVVHAVSVLGFGGWGPILIFVLFKDKHPFIRYHALQGVIFQLGFIVMVIPLALCTFGLGAILILPWMLFECWLAWEAWQGHWAGYPLMEGVGREG